ncbi:hypothetical protein C8R44DRAFT_731529 [Mycena epipterygia]|nr:hypothetical protein C8R44DRAFT_731529 [Mycena epipterygia]
MTWCEEDDRVLHREPGSTLVLQRALQDEAHVRDRGAIALAGGGGHAGHEERDVVYGPGVVVPEQLQRARFIRCHYHVPVDTYRTSSEKFSVSPSKISKRREGLTVTTSVNYLPLSIQYARKIQEKNFEWGVLPEFWTTVDDADHLSLHFLGEYLDK